MSTWRMWAVAALTAGIFAARRGIFGGAPPLVGVDCSPPPPAPAGGLAREEVTPVVQHPMTATSTSLGADV